MNVRVIIYERGQALEVDGIEGDFAPYSIPTYSHDGKFIYFSPYWAADGWSEKEKSNGRIIRHEVVDVNITFEDKSYLRSRPV